MLKKGKLFLALLLTCFLLGNTFGSIAVNAAGNSASQAAQTVETMSKAMSIKHSGFLIMTMMPIVPSIKREMHLHLRSILRR